MRLRFLRSCVPVLASRVIIRNLVFLAAMSVATCFIMTTKTSAAIISVMHVGIAGISGFAPEGCRRYALDDWAACHVLLRNSIAIIFQDFIRYQFTIKENIALRNGQALNGVSEAAAMAGASEFIEPLPQAYDTLLLPQRHKYFLKSVSLCLRG